MLLAVFFYKLVRDKLMINLVSLLSHTYVKTLFVYNLINSMVEERFIVILLENIGAHHIKTEILKLNQIEKFPLFSTT